MSVARPLCGVTPASSIAVRRVAPRGACGGPAAWRRQRRVVGMHSGRPGSGARASHEGRNAGRACSSLTTYRQITWICLPRYSTCTVALEGCPLVVELPPPPAVPLPARPSAAAAVGAMTIRRSLLVVGRALLAKNGAALRLHPQATVVMWELSNPTDPRSSRCVMIVKLKRQAEG